MTLVLHDDLFDAQFVRALAYTRAGGAEIGECVETARRITKTDGELWYREWLATAERRGSRSARTGRTSSRRWSTSRRHAPRWTPSGVLIG